MTKLEPAVANRLPLATIRGAVPVAALVLATWLASCASPQLAVGPDRHLDLPAPLSGPGVPPLEETLRREVEIGWSELAAGATASARRRAATASPSAPARLLTNQVEIATTTSRDLEPLRELVAEYPAYAAARATLSIAAEQAGDESTALEEARRTAALWPAAPWTRRAADLERRFVADRILAADAELAEGHSETALETIDAVLALDSGNLEARLLKGSSLISLGREAEALVLLEAMGSEPRALEILGSLAEADGDWLRAMERYQSLPASWSGREGALQRAQLRWRLSVLPSYVQESLAAAALTRSQLAALLVALAPQLEGLEGGATPLMTDVVGLPMQREILTVVRLELLDSDRLERRFDPGRTVRSSEARMAIDGLAHLLGLAVPIWCEEAGVVTSSCNTLDEPVSGEAVAATVLHLMQESRP